MTARFHSIAVHRYAVPAWLLGRLEDWLLHASPETIEDWDDFTGPCGARIEDIAYMLGHWSIRMRNLAGIRP